LFIANAKADTNPFIGNGACTDTGNGNAAAPLKFLEQLEWLLDQ